MYAVIKTGGKQYRVQAGDVLVVEKLDGEAGAEIAFNEVLMVGEGAVVNATLIETRKGDKVRIFKKIRRQGYRRTKGHRQLESVLRVTSVAAGKGKEDKWDGKVDLTTKAVLDARARNLKAVAEAAAAPVAAPAKKKAEAKAKPAPKAKAAPAVEAEAPAQKAEAAPKKAAPKAKAKSSDAE